MWGDGRFFFSIFLMFVSVTLLYSLYAFCGCGELSLVFLGSDLIADEHIRWFSESCWLLVQWWFFRKFRILVEQRFFCFVDFLNFLDFSVAGCFLFFFNKLMVNVRLLYVRIGGNLSYSIEKLVVWTLHFYGLKLNSVKKRKYYPHRHNMTYILH